MPLSTFHLLGAGRVGQTLAALWSQSGHYRLQQVYSRRPESGQALLQRTLSGKLCADVTQLTPADIIVVTTPDHAIASVAAQLSTLPWLTPDTLVLHCSGLLSSHSLAPLSRFGVQLGSLHPVFAFADVDRAMATLSGKLCALEGDAAALPRLRRLAECIGLQAFVLATEQKVRYHAALSASANFLVTLADFAQSLLRDSALPEPVQQQLVLGLMQQNLDNLHHLPPAAALTGPIVRGDAATVAAHWHSLNADQQNLYRSLAQATLSLAAARLTPAQIDRLQAVWD